MTIKFGLDQKNHTGRLANQPALSFALLIRRSLRLLGLSHVERCSHAGVKVAVLIGEASILRSEDEW